jgi:hypothetical protein
MKISYLFGSLLFISMTCVATSFADSITLCGALLPVEDIGGEGTGCLMTMTNKMSTEVDLSKTRLACIKDDHVQLTGYFDTRKGVERGNYVIFVATQGKKL